MAKSMTAFSRQDIKLDNGQLSCELRSVNHRYLEIFFRLPDELRSQEAALRGAITDHLARGKVECIFNWRATASGSDMRLNEDLATRLSHLSREVDGLLYNPSHINSLEILKWPGVLESDEPDLKPLQAAALTLVQRTLGDLVAARQREGDKLTAILQSRCQALEPQIAIIEAKLPLVISAQRERLQQRFQELKLQLDAERLEQEIAFLAQKMDVDEEIQRLRSHIQEINRILAAEDGKPVGRRLDFLMQELNREANTLCSKSVDADTTRAGVELKVLIEQMREQIQNIE